MAYNPNKELKLYYSIGEVAKMFNVNESLLRFWEKEFPFITPKKAGGNVRQYRKEDIENIRLVYHLVKEKGLTLQGAKHTAVSTPGDLHFHVRATQRSVAYDIAAIITDALRDIAEAIVEVHGFRYWDGRAIIGFVDGTENPHTPASREYFGVVGDEDPEYRGGSYQFVQKYIHDMTAWNNLPVSEQEKVIGRSKQDDIEMPDDVKPSNSHSALSNVGDDFKVIRDNMPFGTVGNNEMGTYFNCYASTFSTVEKMLKNMFIGVPEGNYDRLLDFSTATTGTLFFVPTMDMLGDFSG